jgi:beta-glucanase (GH16 family)
MGLALGPLLFMPETIVAQSTVPQGYQQKFNDEFGLSLDTDCSGNATWMTYWCKWGVRNLSGNNDRAMKADPSYRGTGGPTLAQLGLLTHQLTPAGTLKLYGRVIPTNIRPQFWGFPYVGGMISTERRHAQTYGYWEARVRLNNTSKGHHWAMWLLRQDGSWPPEIDMVEVVGKDPMLVHMNAHGTGKNELVWFSMSNPRG